MFAFTDKEYTSKINTPINGTKYIAKISLSLNK